MRPIFKDPSHNIEFQSKGFIVLPLITFNEIENTLQKVYELSPSDNFASGQIMPGMPIQNYHCTFFDSNKVYKKQLQCILYNFFQPLIQHYFINYEIVMSNVFIKPSRSGYVSPHQNMTIVDEDNYTSISLWCPCVDTNINNGAMQLITGSHKKTIKYRRSSIFWPLFNFFTSEKGQSYFTTIDVNVGSVVIIDDSIIHGTSFNNSEQPRPVIHSIAAPKEAKLFFYDGDRKSSQIRKYMVDKDFWSIYTPGDDLCNFNVKLEQVLSSYDDVQIQDLISEDGNLLF